MHILTSIKAGVGIIEFNRPEQRNALNGPMYAAMADFLEAATVDPSVRVVVFTGQPGIFCAGNDLTEFTSAPAPGVVPPTSRFLDLVETFGKPLVAAVTGTAVGIGVTLQLHCDLVYVAEDAKLSMPFTRLGLVPELASSLLLPQRIGHVRAARLLLLGETYSGREAVDWGLANAALPAAAVRDAALDAARRLAALPPGAIRDTRALMRRAHAAAIHDALAAEADVFMSRLGGPEVKEAVAAFFEKRAADFSRFS
ncbi:enoyl-CoA hydratase-related protein [Denitratisoma oestradiolicum]|uniref:Enoyl-CoA hydratase/carnithine racemase n=1 Tax=Denitratisoma oestradiolicum TaxID=311182 RepID=A0A6S6YI44_9PROT|nr:enoyl-CoA hydratase-related protein [Denitratisoma oestradiolicum]TWO80840.1 enoyl-CoA hydratase [Denitratisoma oestradiolicum]CAB1367414.1 Enoyl-CoA hydratase/carnithine racemase [Denitratisoma oestradiolicum]